jgi:hypothetical protein
VGVDQARCQEPGQGEDLGVAGLGRLGGRTDPGDPAAVDVQHGIGDDGARPVPHDDGPGGESLPHDRRT